MVISSGGWDGKEDTKDEQIFFYTNGAPVIGEQDDFVITEAEPIEGTEELVDYCHMLVACLDKCSASIPTRTSAVIAAENYREATDLVRRARLFLGITTKEPDQRLIKPRCGNHVNGLGNCGDGTIQCERCQKENFVTSSDSIRKAGLHPEHYPEATGPYQTCHKCGGSMMHTLLESWCVACGLSLGMDDDDDTKTEQAIAYDIVGGIAPGAQYMAGAGDGGMSLTRLSTRAVDVIYKACQVSYAETKDSRLRCLSVGGFIPGSGRSCFEVGRIQRHEHLIRILLRQLPHYLYAADGDSALFASMCATHVGTHQWGHDEDADSLLKLGMAAGLVEVIDPAGAGKAAKVRLKL